MTRKEENPTGGKEFAFDQLPETLRRNVAKLGWKEPLPVQAQVIPDFLAGRDLVVQSRTGSGKTGAFGLPICQHLDPAVDEVQALILTPTRELAEQIHRVLRDLAEGLDLRTVAVYGGTAYGPQIEAFKGKVQVIVATPGRIIDHLESNRLNLKKLRILIFDEADEMLSIGFYQSMIKILSYVPDDRQTALFSATIPHGVAVLAERFTTDPVHHSLSGDSLHVTEVDHTYYVVEPMEKDRVLLKIIEMENPEAALIFCNTKREVEYLGNLLPNFGYDGDFISGDLSQAERDKVMQRIRAGQLRFLVATDVAARGIDISDLGYVILYNLPQAHDHYIHRAGRTGRAGESGKAISFVSPREEIELKKRAAETGLNLVKKEVPSDEELERKVSQRLGVMLREKYRSLYKSEKERLQRFIPLVRKIGDHDESVRVVAMLFDRFYQETLHQPLYLREKLAGEGPPPKERSRKGRGREGGRSRGGERRPPRDGRGKRRPR